ncbi:MAG: NAD-dependent epimerase/dehydratase family protein [Candidatus Eremiobacteraeota bacterium]|nr:NAD-dependent epimerase/dehydratase family protein [Candidatus Eremiobacteraeota bacterium]
MKAIVTGAAGFLGRVITEQLLADGHEVGVLVRREVPELEALGAVAVKADLRDRESILTACAGYEAVFHVAAKAGIWGAYHDYHEANVLGTRNILHGCRRHGVKKLIYTSSPSVTFSGKPTPGIDESYPYPKKFLNAYSATKAEAEQMVLAADGKDGLQTVALRPHIIWGPRDSHIIPRLMEAARRGRLLRVGKGDNLVDITYVDNAARAHLLAAERLDQVHGRAFFISQGEPVNLWSWVNQLLQRLDIAPVNRSLSLPVARLLGALLEKIYLFFRLPGEPRMTRFLAAQLGTSHYYDISAARRLLDYEPTVSTAEGMDRLVDWLKASSRPSQE